MTTDNETAPRIDWKWWLMDYAHETGRSVEEVLAALRRARERLRLPARPRGKNRLEGSQAWQ